MRKLLLSIGLCTAALSAALAYADGSDRIYVLGPGGYWLPPTTAQSGWESVYNDSNSLWETSPGSNVYEGVVPIEWPSDRLFFRFVSGLTDETDNYLAWKLNNIYPLRRKGEYTGDMEMTEVGESGVYESVCVAREFAIEEPGCWALNSNQAKEAYFRVDLNEMSIAAVGANTFLIVPDGSPEPTWETLGDYGTALGNDRFLEPGDYSFRLYDVAHGRMLGAQSAESAALDPYGYTEITPSETDIPWTITGFKGGRLSFEMNYRDNLTASLSVSVHRPWAMESPVAYYCVGYHSNWSFEDVFTLYPSETSGDYVGTLPEGAYEFKLTAGPGWQYSNYGWDGRYDRDEDGNLVMGLCPEGMNIALIESTTYGGHTMVVSVPDMTLTIMGKDVQCAGGELGLLDDQRDPSPSAPTDPRLWINFKNESLPLTGSNLPYLHHLHKSLRLNGDGVYAGEIFIPDGGMFNFISALGDAPSANTVIAPSAGDVNVLDVKGEYHADAASLAAESAGFWINQGRGKYYQFTMDPASGQLDFFIPDNAKGNVLYLIGSPNGWNINDGSMQLEEVNKNLFYGAFEVGGDPYFRFYTSLGDWEHNSIGHQVDDWSSDFWMHGGDFYGQCVEGKGCWHIVDWEGGTMHMLVDLNNYTVRLSPQPVAYTPGSVGQDADLVVYNELNNGYVTRYKKNEEGFVVVNQDVNPGEELRLYTRQIPYGAGAPELDSSYALSMLAEPVFDKYGIAKVPFEVIDETTAEKKAKHLRVPDFRNEFSTTIAVDLEENVLYIDKGAVILCEQGTEYPTYRNYGDFDGPMIRNRFRTHVAYIPKGDHRYELRSFAGTLPDAIRLEGEEEPVMFDEDGFYDSGSLGARRLLVLEGWKGGCIALSGSGAAVYDLSGVEDLLVNTRDFNSSTYPDEYRLGRTEGKPWHYSGDVEFASSDSHMPNYISLYAANSPESKKMMSIGYDRAISVGLGMYNEFDDDPSRANVYFVDGSQVVKNVSFADNYTSGLYFYCMETGKVHVEVDLMDATATFTLVQGEQSNHYEILCNGESVFANPSHCDKGMSEAAYSVFSDSEFNIIDPKGFVLVPTEDGAALSMDANGLWKGGYSVISPSEGKSLRQTALEAPKWKVEVDEYSYLTFAVNAEENMILLQSSEANEGYFVSVYDGQDCQVIPTIGNIDRLAERKLTETEPDVFTGEIDIPAGDAVGVLSIHRGLSRDCSLNPFGLTPYSWGLYFGSMTDFSSYVYDEYSGGFLLQAHREASKADVVYDRRNNVVTFSNVRSGVSAVVCDDGLELEPGHGCVTAKASGDTDLRIFAVDGTAIVALTLRAGDQAVISLPKGIYIANGRKLMVM